MKVAFCLYGLSGGFSERIPGRRSYSHKIDIMEESFKSYKKNILDFNKNVKFRIYIHTRNHKNVDKIISMYKPKKYIIDKPILELLEKDKNYSDYNKLTLSQTDISLISRYDSVNKVLSLADGKYDLIFLCRFDLMFLKPLDFSKIILDEKKVLVLSHPIYYYKNDIVTPIHKHYQKIIKNEIRLAKVIKDKKKFLNDHIMIFKPKNKNKIINMGKEHSRIKQNVHGFFADYLNKRFEVIFSELRAAYDVALTRQYLLKGS